jgi:hypothetical protein
MRQLWLPAVAPEVPAACLDRTGQADSPLAEPRTGNPARVVAASAPAPGAVCEAPGGAGAAGTQRAHRERKETPNPVGVVLPTFGESWRASRRTKAQQVKDRVGRPVRSLTSPRAREAASPTQDGRGPSSETEQTQFVRPSLTALRASPAELMALEWEVARIEWAADGGDGSVCSTTELDDVPALNLEWILHGPLLEAMAAVIMKWTSARPSALEQTDNSREAAA